MYPQFQDEKVTNLLLPAVYRGDHSGEIKPFRPELCPGSRWESSWRSPRTKSDGECVINQKTNAKPVSDYIMYCVSYSALVLCSETLKKLQQNSKKTIKNLLSSVEVYAVSLHEAGTYRLNHCYDTLFITVEIASESNAESINLINHASFCLSHIDRYICFYTIIIYQTIR